MEIGKLSNSEDTILTKIIFVKILTATNMYEIDTYTVLLEILDANNSKPVNGF